ncbi:10127_t:CDS:10, partial [Cetraspora pellucida]
LHHQSMSNKRVHEYFKRTAKNWNIVDFLNESIEEPFKRKIDSYLKSLQTIMNSEQDKSRPDCTKAKEWEEKHDSNKWVLTTGTVVEDALYGFGLRCKYEHLAYSFILDPDDDTYLKENGFTESELREIRQFQVKETPLMPLDLIKYLNSFNLKTTSEIRKQIFSPDQMDQDFNRLDTKFALPFHRLQEYELNTLTTDHLELWILVHVWSFTDKVFNDIEEVKVVRGESCSLSSSARKNRERTVPGIADMKRKALGRRGDMIIRKITAEFGCAEAGRQFEGENGTKLLHERGLKMPKMLKDMFKHLCGTFNHDDHNPPIGNDWFPSCWAYDEFGKTLPLISLAWKAKKIVENMISLIEQTNEIDESSEEDQLRRLQDVYDITPLPSRKRKKIDLPTCLDTPSKSSKKVKEIPLGMYMFISLYFVLDLLGPPPPFNLLSSIVPCPDLQCEGENKVTAKFCSDCGKPINGMNTIYPKTQETREELI